MFREISPNPQFLVDLVIFTYEIHNGKFLCSTLGSALLIQQGDHEECRNQFYHILIHCVKSVRIRSCSSPHFSRIFPHSDWIRRDTYLSVFSPNVGKIPTRAIKNTDTFYAVIIIHRIFIVTLIDWCTINFEWMIMLAWNNRQREM